MQLGGRFSVGQAPTSLPQALRARIADIEASLSVDEVRALRWTLTWLEGRPVVELDDGPVLRG
ncbi:unannotated protein [freshwater metagenome]|uniref:Unannotated protein n=1 Tax=freshwater metagenome TaxID=449393 RepID=A0A6J6KJV2_9ZZZZ